MARKKILALAKGLSLPRDAVTQTFGFMAKRGAGKTYAAQKLAEEMISIQAQVVAVDPVGNWWGLRLAANGKDKGLDIPVFGGLHGDLPLRPEAGALIADVLVDTGTSGVVDVSQFRKADRKRFVGDFFEQLFSRRKADPSAMHVFLEEAQVFAPQRVDGSQAKMVGAVEDLVRLGRNFGIGSTLISQRPQSVNKEVLNQVEALFLLQIVGAHERKAVEEWVRYKGIDVREMVDSLPSLRVGEAFVWSPQWLEILSKVKIAEKRTFDASATPTVGATKKRARKLQPLELEAIESAMSSIVEEAKANDPKALQKEIRELKRKLSKLEGAEAPSVDRQAVFDEGVEHGVKTAQAHFSKHMKELKRSLESNLRSIPSVLGKAADSVTLVLDVCESKGFTDAPDMKVPAKSKRRAVADKAGRRSSRKPAPATSAPVRRSGSADLPPVKQKIIDALAWLEALGIKQADRTQLAFIADTSPKSSGYANNLGSLRTAGLIDYPAGAKVCLTDAGRDEANEQESPLTDAELQKMIFAKLAPAYVRILKPLVNAFPDHLDRTELAGLAETSASSSGYANNLGKLRTLGLLDYPGPGQVVAAPILFVDP